MLVDKLDVGGDAGAVTTGHRAELQVLLNGDAQKCAAPLRDMGNPETRDVLGRPAGDAPAVKADVAASANHAAERAQHRCLAGAVGAEQGAHAALIDRETDPEQRLLLAVERVEPVDLEHHRGASPPVLGPVPRYPRITASSRPTPPAPPPPT